MKRRHYFLVYLLIVVLVALAGVWLAGAAWPGSGEEFSIGVPRKVPMVAVDFGKVYYGQTASRTFAVVNTSRRALLLGEKTGCGCTQVKIISPALPPGGRSAVRVSYTGIDPARTGPANQQFLIFTTGKELVSELHGVVRAVLFQSLQFNRTEVYWRHVPGEPAHGGQTVIAENVSSDPISVAWSARGVGGFFSVVPNSAVIAPGANEKFLFRPSAGNGDGFPPEGGGDRASGNSWVRSEASRSGL
jgi:hypothetical protein